MKKLLQFVLTVTMVIGTVTLCAQQDVFRVEFMVTDATCYNNGKVSYCLMDSEDNVLDSLPEGLSMVRAYSLAGPTDTVYYSGRYYTGGYDTIMLNTGTYTIGVEGLLDNGAGGYIRVDTQAVVTVNTTYQKPEASSLFPVAAGQMSSAAGNRPSLSCINTGRVQLRIEKGRFPYKVTVLDHFTGDTLRTEIFHDRQNSGTSSYLYDYQDYYTLDSIGPGRWDFYLEDGCGYGLPKIETTVEVTRIAIPNYTFVCASTRNLADSNVVDVSLMFDKQFGEFKKLMERYVRYRFLYDGLGAGEWKYMTGIYGGTSFIFTDTMHLAQKQCDLWDRDITLEYESTCCDTITRRFTFQIQRPNSLYFEKDTMDVTDPYETIEVSPCGYTFPWHRHAYGIRYYNADYNPVYDLYMTSRDRDHDYYRYHYTHPLTWVYTDARNGLLLKKDTVPQITEMSYLYIHEVERVYGEVVDTMVIPVERKLLDAKGCELYSTIDDLAYMHCKSYYSIQWSITNSNREEHCCGSLREVRLSTAYKDIFDFDGLKVRLIESPHGGRYNFEAVYHAQTDSWEVRKSDIANDAQIIGSDRGNIITLRDYCLTSGPYTFEIISSCDTLVVSKQIAFPDIYSQRFLGRPEYTVVENCSNITVSYSQGRLLRTRFNTSLETGMPLDTIYNSYALCMFIADAPANEIIDAYRNPFTTYTFSQPGRYIIRIAPLAPSTDFCGTYALYDTIDFGNEFVEFEYAKAVLCDSNSTTGNVYVRGILGSEPYTYTLYSQPNKQGEVLGVNQSGDFANVPMRSDQVLSCLIQDSCTAYFHVDFHPNTMADMQKVWFDGGMTTRTSCEGDTIQVHALSIGNILQYEWTGPDGFAATTSDPYVFVPRTKGAGWYRVSIRNSGCGEVITDSVFLEVHESPRIDLSPDTMVCPWAPFEVRFTLSSPTDADSIRFSIAYDNEEGVEIRHYVASNGATVTDHYRTKSPAKIYPVSLDDGRCDYLLADPEDTLHITLSRDLSAACRLLTNHDTVCYGGDALLTAKASMTTPYIIRWYGDYAQTQLLKTDTIADSLALSFYDTLGIVNRTPLFASLEGEGLCPSTNGISTDTLLMHPGTTELQCGRVYRFYDSGGEQPYSPHEQIVHHFRSDDGTAVSITFKEIKLTTTSHLMIFSGDEANRDSLLYDFTNGSLNPGTIVSKGDALTVFFHSAHSYSAGWEAWVENAPGIAIADVWRKNVVTLRDEVCQSQSAVYDDPYGVVPEVVSAEELHLAMRQAGNYYFHKTLVSRGPQACDSIILFEFIVNPPVQYDTTVLALASSEGGFHWHDSLYTQSGDYKVYHSLPDGCDSVEMLHLYLLDVQIEDHEICQGDSADLAVSVATPEGPVPELKRAKAGDVLCMDGTFLSPDSFVTSGKVAKGVVFYTDPTGLHGLVIGLGESSCSMSGLTFDELFVDIYADYSEAMYDMDGQRNTRRMVAMAEMFTTHNMETKVPAAMYCHYYDPLTKTMGSLPNGWYLPSLGEFSLFIGEYIAVNITLHKLQTLDSHVRTLSDSGYWTSSVKRSDQMWLAGFYGSLNRIGRSYDLFMARPITTF